MKHTLRFLVLALFVVCSGCGKPSIRPLSKDSVVVAFGDSLTAGHEVSPGETYPAFLAERLGCRVINSGVGGEVTESGLGRLPAVLKEYRPSLVILCHGGNDLLQKQDKGVISANVERMVAMIRDQGADVILIGVPEPRLVLKPASFYGIVASRHRIPCEFKALAAILSSPALKGDQIHPNAEGNRTLAEAVAALIRQSEAK